MKFLTAQRLKEIGAVVLAFCVVGCATAAQRQLQAIKQTAETAKAELKTCTAAVVNSSDFDPIREHIPLDLRDATLDQLMDNHKATAKEISAIKLVHPRLTECRRTALDELEPVAPSVVVIYAGEFQKNEASLIDLIEQKLSWGEYITKVRETNNATQADIMAEAENIQSELERSHEAELGRRQAAANAMMQYYQTEQMINAMNRPHFSTANCFGTGSMVNCTGVSQ
jgi:hypothetical protein